MSLKTRSHWILKEVDILWETRCKKSWDQFEEYDSHSLRNVKQVSGKTKDHRLNKHKIKIPYQRSPYALNFEDRSQEETERQQRCARSKAWNLAKKYTSSKKRTRPREFVVDSGAGMHMVSKKDLNSAELETMRISRNPTTVMTANGEAQTREEATVYVKKLDLFVTVMLLEDTPAVLSLGNLCEDHGYTYHWTSGQKTHLIRNGKRIDCNISNYAPFLVPALSTRSSTSSTPTSSFNMFIARFCDWHGKSSSRKKWKYE